MVLGLTGGAGRKCGLWVVNMDGEECGLGWMVSREWLVARDDTVTGIKRGNIMVLIIYFYF
ncbi:hypothetical protein AS034_18295 [[Bacillus] enclensis]|nr:hypothetical protein AS034_18295 [[Bacillus] enclensis]